MKLTELQMKALLEIAVSPGIRAGDLAMKLVDRRWSNQGATRWGAGYASRLIKAGLVFKDTYKIYGGWAKLHLTNDGRRTIRNWPMADADQAYRADGDCICKACGKTYISHHLGGPLGHDGNSRDGMQYLNRLCNGDLVKL